MHRVVPGSLSSNKPGDCALGVGCVPRAGGDSPATDHRVHGPVHRPRRGEEHRAQEAGPPVTGGSATLDRLLVGGVTSSTSPSITATPFCSQIARVQFARISLVEWWTRNTTPAFPLSSLDPLAALAHELRVAGRQRLVDEQHLRRECGADGEAQPRRHAGRVRHHGQVDEVADPGELDDVLVLLLDLLRLHPHRQAAEDRHCAHRSGCRPGRRSRPAAWAGSCSRRRRSWPARAPEMADRRVDLPDPLLPMSPMASPRRATRETPRTACTCLISSRSDFSRSRRRFDSSVLPRLGAPDPVDDMEVVHHDQRLAQLIRTCHTSAPRPRRRGTRTTGGPRTRTRPAPRSAGQSRNRSSTAIGGSRRRRSRDSPPSGIGATGAARPLTSEML